MFLHAVRVARDKKGITILKLLSFSEEALCRDVLKLLGRLFSIFSGERGS